MQKRASNSQGGTTLIETMIAVAICTIVVFSLAGLVTLATRQSKDMGTTAAQAAALAAEQMDIFMAIRFADTQLNAGGSLTTNTTGYVDYLKVDGTPTTSGAVDLFFTRRWDVSTTGLPAGLKLIRVRVQGRAIGQGVSPAGTVGAYKSDEQSPTPTV
jgi:Tfp pilus assembly protein PilV